MPAESLLPAEAWRRRTAATVERVWAVFTDWRLSAGLALALALALSFGGLANPGNAPLGEFQAALGDRWWFPVYRFVALDDVFHGWWFLLLLVLLVLNLAALSLAWLPATVRIALRPERRVSPQLLRGLPLQRQAKLPDRDPRQAAARVAEVLRARGFAPESVPENSDPSAGQPVEPGAIFFFAERGRLARLGVVGVALGLFAILDGALLGQLCGVQGVINVPADSGKFDYLFRTTSGGATYKEPLGFAVRVEAFRLVKSKAGQPEAVPPLGESDLAVLEGAGSPAERVVRRQTVRAGEPLAWAGWSLLQLGYQAIPERDQVRVHVIDKQTQAVQDLTLAHGESFKVGPPGAPVDFKAVNYTPNLADLGPALQLERSDGGKTGRFWVLEKYPDFDTDNRGDRFGLRFDGLVPFYVTGLRLVKDPGYPWCLAGSLLLALSLALSLSTTHGRLWARIGRDGQLTLAGVAHRNRAQFEALFNELLAALGVATGGPTAARAGLVEAPKSRAT